jgi:AmmeMemoRadiSam system protein B
VAYPVLRLPAVAGRFYPDDPEELDRQIATFVPSLEKAPRPAIACMVPHAGYRYSGHVAGAVYADLKLPRRFLLLGPRHFPRGKMQAIASEGAWQTPLGRAGIDSDLARELTAASAHLCEDTVAHQGEHALEVQLPFLQYLSGDVRFVPIALGPADYAHLESLGHAMAGVLRQQAESVLMIASSDMNHYESDEITRRKDRLALEPILELDARGLFDTVRREGVSMCGFGPMVSVLTAARLLGATRATLVRYATSGDIDGDLHEVVGYAGVVIE